MRAQRGSAGKSGRVHVLPTPTVGAHRSQVAFGFPSERLARERGVCITGRHIPRAPVDDLVGDLAAARTFVGENQFEHAVTAAGTQVDRERTAVLEQVSQCCRVTFGEVDDVDVVAHPCAVVCVVVVAEDLQPFASARLAGRRVLVVDDNATNRQILRHQLGYWGLRVTAVESGPKGLALLQQAASSGTGYDLAILDMKMPEMDGLALARAVKGDAALASVRLVLLTSFGQRGHGAEASRIGIAAYLTKPVDEADLYDCLVEVLDETRARRASHLVTRHSLREQRPAVAAAVLVAEDNEVNQKVAVKILEKLGYRVELAENGKEALAACARRRYDAVLMDGQMPGMDGYEATRKIRERETRGGRRLPIIAMTASAMKGDREKCLESGMDDYVTKPVTPENLEAVLRKWVGAASAPAERAAAEPATSGTLLDEAIVQSLLSVDDDGTLMDEVVATFLRIAPARLAAIRKAAKGNAAMLEREAHSFLGSCGNIGAQRMAELCARLEVLGRSGSTEGAPEIARTLEEELVSVRPQLEALPGRHPKRASALPSRT